MKDKAYNMCILHVLYTPKSRVTFPLGGPSFGFTRRLADVTLSCVLQLSKQLPPPSELSALPIFHLGDSWEYDAEMEGLFFNVNNGYIGCVAHDVLDLSS